MFDRNRDCVGGKRHPAYRHLLALQHELHDVQLRLDEAESEVKKAQSECPPYVPAYAWMVTEESERHWLIPEDVKGERIRIQGKLTNAEDFHARNYYVGREEGRPYPTESVRSVIYFRVNGVLCEAGGGSRILKPHSVVSDEQWARILEWDIPEELLK